MVTKSALVLSLVLQNVYFVTRRALRVQLAGLKDVLANNLPAMEVLSHIPTDPRTCLTYFDVDPDVSKFLCCPECHCLYSMNTDLSDLSHCRYQSSAGSSVCGTSLWKSRKIRGDVTRQIPVRTYIHQDIRKWLGRLFSWPGIEDMVDNQSTGAQDVVEDIWSSKVFRNLKDSDNRPFYPGPQSEA